MESKKERKKWGKREDKCKYKSFDERPGKVEISKKKKVEDSKKKQPKILLP